MKDAQGEGRYVNGTWWASDNPPDSFASGLRGLGDQGEVLQNVLVASRVYIKADIVAKEGDIPNETFLEE